MRSMRLLRKRQGWPRRAGFTLIELLTVIAIIAVLATLSAAAVIKFIGVQYKSNTTNALNKVAPLVKSAWVRVAEEAKRETPNSAMVQNLAGGNTQRAQVIWTYLRVQQAFPQSFNEVFNPPAGALPGLPNYQAYLSNLGINQATAASQDGPYSSAACLLMALQRRVDGGGVSADDLGKASTQLVKLPNGNTISVLVDGWGTPLWFIRYPTSFAFLNPGGPQPGVANDPLDPQGLLASQSQTWLNSPGRSQFQGLFHLLPSSAGVSYVIQPVIVSSGPDQQLGIDGFGNVLNAGQAQDNLDTVSTQP
jgi:prepilin-type N-terminal cleavage/methylation domain-containing protein